MENEKLNADVLRAAALAALTLKAIYEWVDRVEAAGGTTSISGVAACHAMLKSLKDNKPRTIKLVVHPLTAALNAASDKSEAASRG